MNLCLFDLDDTLLPLDSDHAWGEFVISLGWVDEPSFRRTNDSFFAQYQAGQLDVHGYIEFATRPLRERSADELAAAHRLFMQRVIEPQLRDSARDLVRGHQALGDRVVLVTATNEFVTAPIAAAFGIESLIAVRLERDARGSISGRIKGTPSYREGKVRRVEEWLGEQALSWADCERITVYSDSLNDLPLLEKATDPVATNPSPALLSVATERGWRTLNLFT
ncbi:MAG: HAD-IB family hydrolase [Burkholderiaceae bacterium]|nr:HAD-IB family hydrolase [Burkholderiaceae bacterium]